MAAKDKELDRLNGVYKHLLGTRACRLSRAARVLVDPHTVEVGGKR